MKPWADYIVTGGCGFIGSAFLRHMVKQYPHENFLNIDNLTCGSIESVDELETLDNYKFEIADITDKKEMRKLVAKGSTVINFAAESHVDNSIKDSTPFLNTNIIGTYSLLEAAKANDVKKFILVSTDEVYGSLGLDNPASREEDPRKPRSPYSASKAAAEHFVEAYHETFGLPTIITRSSNNFGPFQYPEKVIPLFVTNVLEGKKVPLYGTGNNIRDWIYVDDNVKALELIINKGKIGEVYNIGGNNEINNLSLTYLILNNMGKGHETIQYVEDRKGHDRRYALNCDKIKQLGWKVPGDRHFEDNLQKTINWYKQNREWWQPLKDSMERKK